MIAVIGLAATLASAGIPEPTMVSGRTIARWDFTRATEERATNVVAGMPDLKAGADAPAAVAGGLQFNNGACLRGAGVPGLLDGKTPPTHAYLYVDGKLDGAVKASLPAATSAEIVIGNSAGQDYYYNGIIQQLDITELVEPKKVIP